MFMSRKLWPRPAGAQIVRDAGLHLEQLHSMYNRFSEPLSANGFDGLSTAFIIVPASYLATATTQDFLYAGKKDFVLVSRYFRIHVWEHLYSGDTEITGGAKLDLFDPCHRTRIPTLKPRSSTGIPFYIWMCM
jgi:hypothetical protein